MSALEGMEDNRVIHKQKRLTNDEFSFCFHVLEIRGKNKKRFLIGVFDNGAH